MTFGSLLSERRQQAGFTLRDFAERIDYDPSNVSKIERGVLSPPKSRPILKKWAITLGLDQSSKGFADFIAQGMAANIQRKLKSDAELVRLLPAFCRTIENKKLDPDTYKRLIAILRQNT